MRCQRGNRQARVSRSLCRQDGVGRGEWGGSTFVSEGFIEDRLFDLLALCDPALLKTTPQEAGEGVGMFSPNNNTVSPGHINISSS